MTVLRLRIRTPSRLHFGLLSHGPLARRQFGGVGLMIESPGVELVAEAAHSWGVEGSLASRVEQLVGRVREQMLAAGMRVPPAKLCIRSVPEEHVGLGVGTQLSLAVARALLKLAGLPEAPVDELARLTGRGSRSGIGLHGFYHGGLIVDGGRKQETGVPPLLCRVPFPEDWLILIVRPRGRCGLHGLDEVQAFAGLPPIPQSVTDSLCRLVLLEILPAVIEHDLAAFGASLSELQARVGACFGPVQGGAYAVPGAAAIVDLLHELGFVGVGQSSWGPTLYGFAQISSEEMRGCVLHVCRKSGLDKTAVFVTRAANRGATLCVES